MTPHHPYIVLDPDMRTNITKRHAVVHVQEWLAVTLGEKEGYEFLGEYDDYASAAVRREELNHRLEGFSMCPADEEEEITV